MPIPGAQLAGTRLFWDRRAPLDYLQIRTNLDDFQVEEILKTTPSGTGEHLWLQVEKRGWTTEQMKRELAKASGIKVGQIGHAGLKDRHALTRQWVSLPLGQQAPPEWDAILPATIRVRQAVRHTRKLRHAVLAGNRFRLTLRACRGNRRALTNRLSRIAQVGVPNYFGEQRFGRDAANLSRARAMGQRGQLERNRFQRGLLLSAARAALFNRLLAMRVADGTWGQVLPGEILALAGTQRYFGPVAVDATLRERVARADIHPTGPLWGAGPVLVSGELAGLETRLAAREPALLAAVELARMTADRRPLRVIPQALDWHWKSRTQAVLQMVLPAGSFATVVLAALAAEVNDVQH